MKLKNFVVFIIILSMFFSAGCWDKIEIDERAFVLAIAIDKDTGGKDKSESGSPEQAGKKGEGGNYKVVFYMPIPSKLQGGDVKTFTTEESTGKNIPEAIQKLSLKFSRMMFFGQTKILLIGEKVVQDEKMFKGALDFIEREPDMGREMQVAVIKGSSEDLSNIKPKFEKVFAAYMKGVFDNSGRLSSALSLSANELLSSMRNNEGRAAIPALKVSGDKATINELALINNFKLINYLDTKNVRGYSIITNKLKDGGKLINFKDSSLGFRVTSFQRRLWLDEDGDKPRYRIEVRIEGDINSYTFGDQVFIDDVVGEITEKIRASIAEDVKNDFDYFQKNIGYDFLMIGDYTRKYHNSVYKKYEDRWDEVFKKAQLDTDVQVFIRRVGGTR